MRIFNQILNKLIINIYTFNKWRINYFSSQEKNEKIKLTYRGVSYKYNTPIVQVTESTSAGKYRGNPWRLHQLKEPLILKNKINLSYRGVSYFKKFTDIKATQESKIIKSTEKEKKTANSVEIPIPHKNYEEIIDQIPSFLDALTPEKVQQKHSYRLVLNRDILKERLITTSGEAEIWQVTGEVLKKNNQNYLAKIYHQKTPEQIKNLPERQNKLEVMVVHQPTVYHLHKNHVSLSWPQYLLEDSSGKVVGFLMQFIGGSKLTNVYHPTLRKRLNLELEWQIDWQFLHLTAKNLALIIQSLHAEGYVVGDMKPQNILVNEQALPSIIDTDSFQISNSDTSEIYRCLVGSEGLTPPELLGKDFASNNQNTAHDNFRLAVIIYHLLFREHPFKGHWLGDGDSPGIDDLIRQCFWPYASKSLIQPGKTTIPIDIIHPRIKECFLKCFNQGHRNPKLRPTAIDWANALQVAIDDLVQCENYSSHWYSKAYGECYWCESNQRSPEYDIFPPSSQYNRLNRLLKAGNWKEADLETKYLMLKITNRIDKGWLDESAIKNFPLQDLGIIDQLWQEHSSGRFGFSVQRNIYIDTGNHPGKYNREIYSRFAETVGWRGNGIWKNYFDLEFSLKAPPGNLPFCCAGFDVCLVSHLALQLEKIETIV
ncbi:MAG: DUF4278 domain-containing protein [Symploca sp. SIO3C6]|nr:DUF4278 domain-containing protein [Symploca sp. SIO3C6]